MADCHRHRLDICIHPLLLWDRGKHRLTEHPRVVVINDLLLTGTASVFEVIGGEIYAAHCLAVSKGVHTFRCAFNLEFSYFRWLNRLV